MSAFNKEPSLLSAGAQQAPPPEHRLTGEAAQRRDRRWGPFVTLAEHESEARVRWSFWSQEDGHESGIFCIVKHANKINAKGTLMALCGESIS